MFTLSATQCYGARVVASRPTAQKKARSTIVRAEAETESAPAVWTAPKLNPNTPSPIFGGSTGGLLRKAQVRARERSRGGIAGMMRSQGARER